jgi:hypothetical protein
MKTLENATAKKIGKMQSRIEDAFTGRYWIFSNYCTKNVQLNTSLCLEKESIIALWRNI